MARTCVRVYTQTSANATLFARSLGIELHCRPWRTRGTVAPPASSPPPPHRRGKAQRDQPGSAGDREGETPSPARIRWNPDARATHPRSPVPGHRIPPGTRVRARRSGPRWTRDPRSPSTDGSSRRRGGNRAAGFESTRPPHGGRRSSARPTTTTCRCRPSQGKRQDAPGLMDSSRLLRDSRFV